MPKFIGRCDELEEGDLHAFDETASDVTAGTVRRRIGFPLWKEF